MLHRVRVFNGVSYDKDIFVDDGIGEFQTVILIKSTETVGVYVPNTNYIYLCSGTFTYTQPTAINNKSKYTLKNNGAGVITIAFTSTQTGDGSTRLTLRQNSSIDLISDNTNWFVI